MPGWLRNCSRTSIDHPAGRPADGHDQQAGEEEHHGRADDQAEQVVRRVDAEAEAAQVLDQQLGRDLGAERAEQRGRGQDRGRDGDALGDGLGGVAHRVQPGQHLRGLALDLAGHLGDALSVVRDRAEGVHRDDDADRGQQAGAGQRDGEQRDRGVAGAEQEGAVNRAADQQRRVHRRLQADRDAGQDHGGRAGQRALADFLHRLAVGLGEVAGQQLDGAGQDQADDDGADGQQPRVAAVVQDRWVGDAHELR